MSVRADDCRAEAEQPSFHPTELERSPPAQLALHPAAGEHAAARHVLLAPPMPHAVRILSVEQYVAARSHLRALCSASPAC